MSRPAYITDEMRDNIVKRIDQKIHEAMLYDKTIQVKPEYKPITAIAELVFEPKAFLKMYTLVDYCKYEVAWHGLVRKEKDDHSDFKARYVVEDILLYPQEVSGATVESDDDTYAQWHMSLDMETANKMLLHGHSHVSMSVSPSSRDIDDQLCKLKQLGKRGFYIFMIMNKKNEFFFKIVDMDDNVIYDTQDIAMSVDGGDFDWGSWIGSATEYIKTKYVQTVKPKSKTTTTWYTSGYELPAGFYNADETEGDAF